MPKSVKNVENIKAILTLVGIAAIAALILSLVYSLTRVDPSIRLKEKISHSYNSPITDVKYDISDYQNLDSCQILEIFTAEDGAVLILSKATNSYSANGIELIVIINEGKIISVLKYKSTETPGLGSKAVNQSYLDNFKGVLVEEVKPSEKGIAPNITGATRSSNAVRYAIEAACDVYKYLNDKGVLNA